MSLTCRIVKLTSPNLNYFTIAGTVLMYASTYFYLLPETSEPVIVARCIVSSLEHINCNIHELSWGSTLVDRRCFGGGFDYCGQADT